MTRNEEIFKHHTDGLSYNKIAAQYDISRERVHQIVKKEKLRAYAGPRPSHDTPKDTRWYIRWEGIYDAIPIPNKDAIRNICEILKDTIIHAQNKKDVLFQTNASFLPVDKPVYAYAYLESPKDEQTKPILEETNSFDITCEHTELNEFLKTIGFPTSIYKSNTIYRMPYGQTATVHFKLSPHYRTKIANLDKEILDKPLEEYCLDYIVADKLTSEEWIMLVNGFKEVAKLGIKRLHIMFINLDSFNCTTKSTEDIVTEITEKQLQIIRDIIKSLSQNYNESIDTCDIGIRKYISIKRLANDILMSIEKYIIPMNYFSMPVYDFNIDKLVEIEGHRVYGAAIDTVATLYTNIWNEVIVYQSARGNNYEAE